MKLQPERIDGLNAVKACDAHSITINTETWTQSLVIPSQGEVSAWGVNRFDDLRAEHFDRLLALEPELVIFGSGQRMRFVSPALMAALFARRIGVETMTTIAACRTYNVLVSENRRVVLAALLDA
ncbi:MAG: Mth938-like domain-containing protein [Leptothrix ochracea]|uniref:Mth938-like domain-containing protein n=1 Tax=Leptothrix ochracea TaxID=735331 RepID=UPI0034E2CC75